MNYTILLIFSVILFCILYYYKKYNNLEHYAGAIGVSNLGGGGSFGGSNEVNRINILGPTITGLNAQNYIFQTNYAQNIDPYKLEVRDGNIIMIPYENNVFNTFNENNTRESLIFASLREIMRNVKTKLNSKNITDDGYNLNDVINISIFKLNNSNVIINTPVFQPIISSIIKAINSSNNTLTVTPIKTSKYLVIFNKEQNIYIVDSLIDINVSHPFDSIYNSNKINMSPIPDNPYDVKQYQDNNSNIIPNNTLPLQLIIKFTVKPPTNQNINDTIIYINDLAVIQKILS